MLVGENYSWDEFEVYRSKIQLNKETKAEVKQWKLGNLLVFYEGTQLFPLLCLGQSASLKMRS